MRLVLLIAGLVLSLLPLGQALAAAEFEPGVPEMNAASQLASAQNALAQLAAGAEGDQRASMYGLAITSLTALYQLHGCEWALEPLSEIYAQPDCPEMYYGFSADGRIALRVERLRLQNPVFADSAIYLCQLESNSALTFKADSRPGVVFVLEDGSRSEAQPLSEEHPLWESLDRIAGTFTAPDMLYSGAAAAFKQIYAGREESVAGVSTVIFTWSEYSFELTVPRGN